MTVMHELSIVQSIVDIAETQVRQAGARQVDCIELDIGQLAGVEWSALDFAWEVAVRHTVLQGAERVVRRIPGKAKCLECQKVFNLSALYDACPDCNAHFHQILSGRELRVSALTVS